MFVFLFLFLFNTVVEESDVLSYRVYIQNESGLKINGRSNVNQFSFDYDTRLLQREMSVKIQNHDGHFHLENATLRLKVEGFDSGNPIMNKDLYKLVNTEVFPHINISFESVIPTLHHSNSNRMMVNAKVSMAGETHNENLEVIRSETGRGVRFFGRTNLNLKNYCIEPPTKFMGMVKVHEELSIQFDIQVDAVSI